MMQRETLRFLMHVRWWLNAGNDCDEAFATDKKLFFLKFKESLLVSFRKLNGFHKQKNSALSYTIS